MFSKKPAPPPAPQKPAPAQPLSQPATKPAGWAVQILTADYIASGYLTPIDMPLVGWLNVPTQTMVALSNAQLTALDPRLPVAAPAMPEVTVPKASIIAVIPRDEMSQRSAAVQMPPQAAPAMIYAGPYYLRASFRLVGGMPLRNLFGATTGDMLVVSDAEIRCLRAETNLPVQKAAVIIVNKSRVQLYHPA
jgi:hypothetical protein